MPIDDDKPRIPGEPLHFTAAELLMLGQTADALSAYMGCVVLAEVGRNEDTEWVIFARAIGQDEEVGSDVLHVQMGGPNARVLGQQGGLDAADQQLDCEFLWAVEITDDPDERFVRLNQDGEVFDAASDLAELLPFSLQDPDQLLEEDLQEDEDGEQEDEEDDDQDPADSAPGNTRPPTIH